ncbi:hypothetical protein F4778DRAFT_783616 [Xylariomycetidae sp. FL2044]|nr:hypothetical protein F4778DRAFT_783616 [Xylariomycetidae sp. FL2044]
MFSRHSSTGFCLATACLVVLILTAKRLGEWSLRRPGYRVPTLHRPSSQTDPNSIWSTPAPDRPPPRPYDPSCAVFPDTSSILVIVKTGATEAYSKIPSQLLTFLRCAPDFLIFSDMPQKIGGFDVHDSLDSVLTEVKEGSDHFDLYRSQLACPLDQEGCNVGNSRGTAAWNLDKYKNIHMAEKTYRMRPNYSWYLFIDGDTYIVWSNLVQWLRQLDPSKDHYIGSVTLINDMPFAHGGSGYVLSQAAMRQFAGNHAGVANRFDLRMNESCCGDHLLSVALNETIGLKVEQVWPIINGETPYTIPYGPRQWCHPVVTMHHMNPEDIFSLDLYEEFVSPKLLAKRQDWDNLSEDIFYLDPRSIHDGWMFEKAKKEGLTSVEKNAHKSYNHCRQACATDKLCFQFLYRKGACSCSRAFKLGKPSKRPEKGSQRLVSGWMLDRIQSWIEDQGQCNKPSWPLV